MYYEQRTDKYQSVPEYWYTQANHHERPHMTKNTFRYVSRQKRVYSFRSRRPKNDSTTAIVPGESLVVSRPRANHQLGVGSYLASYRAALQSLNDEAAQKSGNSGYGAMDKGHRFASLNVKAVISSLEGVTRFTYDGEPGGQALYLPFSSAVSVCPIPAYYGPGSERNLPKEVRNTIQELAVSTIPDKITGSLGQDLVDLAELPRLVRHLTSIGRDLTNLRQSWERLSVKVRHAIDTCIRERGKAPKWALRSAGSGYLEWLFVLQPYIEDMQTVLKFLSSTSSSLLNRYSFTKNKRAVNQSRRFKGGGHGGSRYLTFDNMENHIFSVHLAICWVHRGPLPSDGTFAEKACQMNRSLGLWYPSLLWDLMPWTWLIDWTTHIGDSINGTYAISNSNYRPAYAWATVRNSLRWCGQFSPTYREDVHLETNFFDVENYSLCRFPVQVTGVVQPGFTSLSSSQKFILSALGLSHIK